MKRRDFPGGIAFTGLSGCVRKSTTPAVPFSTIRLAAIRAEVDRIFRVTVCVRPFREAGPRLDVERVGDQTVVHNYGSSEEFVG